jgi:hypothetical protein
MVLTCMLFFLFCFVFGILFYLFFMMTTVTTNDDDDLLQ